MNILGISAFYHDSAAALVIDGVVVAAIEEERFSRIKHDNNFPHKAIEFCLQSAGLTITDIDVVAYYEKPLLKFERLLETFVSTYPHALKPFLRSVPEWLGQKIKIENIIRKEKGFSKKIYFIPHHLSHAAAAFYTSPFKESAVLTVDGVGEYQTTALWHANNKQIINLTSINFPHSIGLLYSTFTAFLGFKINEDEYKVMGLSAYGKPNYVKLIKKIIDIKSDGSFALDMRYFSFQETFQMWSHDFEELFGQPRKPSESINKRHKDIAASIQLVTEEVLSSMIAHLHSITHEDNLCLSGGVALNALANGKMYARTKFKKIHIFGAASDSGSAIGAALFTQYSILKSRRVYKRPSSVCVGSSYSNESIKSILDMYSLKYAYFKEENELLSVVADLLKKNKILGWFQGRCEFGPRALGNRSIIASTNPKIMKKRVNVIKRREQFRPFAGSVLQEHVQSFFEVPEENYLSPYMNFCFQVKKEKRLELAAIVHQDNTCRIQTVNSENGRYYRLISHYYKQSGIPCILNTSFNIKGEPLVEHPRQAVADFLRTQMDYLVIGDYVVSKH